jgi:hypothetical protein
MIISKNEKKLQKQGLVTSIWELKNIIKDLEKQMKEMNKTIKKFSKKDKIDNLQKWQLNIINKNGASDGWRFEK